MTTEASGSGSALAGATPGGPNESADAAQNGGAGATGEADSGTTGETQNGGTGATGEADSAKTGEGEGGGTGEGETKAEGDDAGEKGESKESDDSSENSGAPEQYEQFTFPEGFQVSDEMVKGFEAKARELNLTQEQAQSLVDYDAERAAAFAEVQDAAYEAQINEWKDQSANDKEFGGPDYEKNRAIAVDAINQYGSPEFVKFYEDTGIGDHPEFIRFCFRVGKTLQEDTASPGGQGGGGGSIEGKPLSEVLYPDQANKPGDKY